MENGENGVSEHELGSSDVGQSLDLRKMIEKFGSMELKELEQLVRKVLECPSMLKMLEPLMVKILESPLVLKMLEPLMLKILERPMVLKKLEPMVLNIFGRVMPSVKGLLSNVVREEIQKFLPGGSRNDVPKERRLQLKFLYDVSGPAKSGMELKGVKDNPLEVRLVDETGHIVSCGSESSAKVEIVLLDDSDDVNKLNRENFERRIIREGNKEKPHFPKSVYIYLEKGVGKLIGLKLGHDKHWTKPYNCRLGARIVQNLEGIIVQEAWTAPFNVIDKRGKQYCKHYPPTPSSDVWRLEKIDRKGEPCKRLIKENILTVPDLLFWYTVNPEGLQQILDVYDGTRNAIITHACTCKIDDEKMYLHKSPTEPQMGVIYDAVGEVKGVIDDSHFVPIDNLCADKKDDAHKLLMSVLEQPAFGKRYKTVFNDEASLLHKYPYKSISEINASTSSSIQHCSNGNDLCLSSPGSSSPIIIPTNIYGSGSTDSLGLRDMRDQLSNPENIGGDTPIDLDYEIPTSRVLGKRKADAQELLESACNKLGYAKAFNDMNHLPRHYLPDLGTPMDSVQAGSSSRRSNTPPSHSISSRMNSFGVSDDEMRGVHAITPPTLSPNPFLYYSSEDYIVNIEMYGHTKESTAADETAAEPQIVNTHNCNVHNRWKQLYWKFSIIRMVSQKGKKQRVG